MKKDDTNDDHMDREYGEESPPASEEELRGVDHIVKWLSDN